MAGKHLERRSHRLGRPGGRVPGIGAMVRSRVRKRVALATGLALLALGVGGTASEAGKSSAPAAGPNRCAKGSLECAFCASFARHAAALGRATREVGALPNGVVILYRCDSPETVVELQRYAFEKQKLREKLAASPEAVKLCETCGALLDKLKGATFEVANSVHGVFTLITSSDPDVVRELHKLASEETQAKGVRGS